MAYRDTSQGFGFVYFDLKTFLENKEELFAEEYTPWDQYGVATVNVTEPASPPAHNKESVETIKKNLDRLQSLHHKLHVMLEDLKGAAPRKRKK